MISLINIIISLLTINYVKNYFENRDAKMFIRFETHKLRFFRQFDINSKTDLNNLIFIQNRDQLCYNDINL